MEQEIVAFAGNLYETNPMYAYIFFFINAVLQVLFPPYPGDSLIVFQGYLSSTKVFNSYSLLFTSLIATYLSSLFLYHISFKHGRKIINNKFISKYFDTNKIVKLEGWFNKYGTMAIIFNKFIPGVGSLTLIAAGIFKLPHIPAFISIGVATLIHNSFLFYVGRVAGNNIEIIKHTVKEYQYYIVFALLILGLIYTYSKFYLNKKKTSN
jgi:membrane protein DedA with SNARE-associated domain